MLFRSISVAIGLALILSSCGGGGGSSGDTTATAAYSVGGSISGLTSGSLVLKNNGDDALTVNANSATITFATSLANSASYAVTVGTQPSGLTCSVSNGTGTVASANVTNVTVTCATNAYTVGGTVSGLASGTSVILQVNSSNSTTVSSNGSFTFSTPLASATSYTVTVATQPNGLTCTVSTGTGTIAVADITDVTVACADNWSGTKLLGVALGRTNAQSVATDKNSNVYVAGYTEDNLDGNIKVGIRDFFVTKYNSSGVRQSTKQLGVSGAWTYGYAVATDKNSNVYVSGFTNGNLDGNTLTGLTDFFVIKYNSSGVKQFTKQLGVSGALTSGYAVATDTSGNVYVVGRTMGNLDGNILIGTEDLFVTKYNSSGEKQYTRQLGANGAQTVGMSVATDLNGNVYVAGYTDGNLDGNTLTGGVDFFVTKYSSSGVKQYTKQLGGVSGETTMAYSAATDASGNLYIAGFTGGNLDGNIKTGIYDFFVTKYDSTGAKQFTKQLGAIGAQTIGKAITTDENGNVYVAGYTSGNLDGNTLTGPLDSFVTKYSSIGVKQYTKQLGASGAGTLGNSVATDTFGNAYVAGVTSANLDNNTLTGYIDLFVTKYNSSGVKQ